MSATIAIARVTGREVLRDGTFLLIALVAAFLIFFSQFLPFFGEMETEVRLVKDMGFATLVLAGALSAALYASSVVDEEMEQRTVLMILSKPVGRGSFLLGKYLGILGAEFLLFAALGAVLAFSVWHKQSYDNEDHVFRAAEADPGVWQGTILAFAEVAVVASLAVAWSAWFPPAAAILGLAALFLAGHVVQYLSFLDGTVPSLLRVWIPNLGLFRISDAMGLGLAIPWSYVGCAWAYASAYAALSLAVGVLGLTRKEIG